MVNSTKHSSRRCLFPILRSLCTFVLLIGLFKIKAIGQVGFSGGVSNFKSSEWLDAIGERANKSIASLNGWEAGVDYWFRLKQKRVEFTLEGNYSRFSDMKLPDNGKLTLKEYGLQLNTNIYPLDFGSDCNCPTWSKNGDFFKKGFFLQLIAGGAFMDKHLEAPNFLSDDSAIVLRLGAGVGLDIGLSDFITITPLVRYYYLPNLTWEGIATEKNGSDTTNGGQVFAGLRLGLRFDELYKYSIRSY